MFSIKTLNGADTLDPAPIEGKSFKLMQALYKKPSKKRIRRVYKNLLRFLDEDKNNYFRNRIETTSDNGYKEEKRSCHESTHTRDDDGQREEKRNHNEITHATDITQHHILEKVDEIAVAAPTNTQTHLSANSMHKQISIRNDVKSVLEQTVSKVIRSVCKKNLEPISEVEEKEEEIEATEQSRIPIPDDDNIETASESELEV